MGIANPYLVHQTNRAKMRNGDLGITFDSPDHRIVGTTESSGIFCHGIQHRLDVRWRFGDHAQDRVGRSLLLQRFGELLVTILQVFKRCFLPL